jgi:hypothetical protein
MLCAADAQYVVGLPENYKKLRFQTDLSIQPQISHRSPLRLIVSANAFNLNAFGLDKFVLGLIKSSAHGT